MASCFGDAFLVSHCMRSSVPACMVGYRSSLCCCRRLSLIVRIISNSRRTSAFSSSVQGCRVPSGAIQWQTSASALMIFCQSFGRLGTCDHSRTKATLSRHSAHNIPRPFIAALRLGLGDALPLPLQHGLPLRLRHGADNRQHEPAHRRARVQAGRRSPASRRPTSPACPAWSR